MNVVVVVVVVVDYDDDDDDDDELVFHKEALRITKVGTLIVATIYLN